MSRKHNKKWRAKVQQAAQATRPEPQLKPHQLRGMARREWIEQQAQAYYELRVGDTIDLLIRSCKHTAVAFDSQMKAARGEGEGFGPDVSPYENRMTGALIGRLLREKRTWLREMRKEIEQALDDEAAWEQEQAEAEAGDETQAEAGRAVEPVEAQEAVPKPRQLSESPGQSP
jgi:hypothetical protein